jgi:hypothetical protein
MDSNLYLDQFLESKFIYSPAEEDEQTATLNIQYKKYEIDLYMISNNNSVSPIYVDYAKVALINLDSWLEEIKVKKLINFETDDLSWIEIHTDGVELRFVGIKSNGDIGIFFEKNEKLQWVLEGYC